MLALAPLPAALFRCSGILRGDECVAFVIIQSRALLGLGADFHQLLRDFFNAPAALRGP
jgi:hypothetical protein